MPKSKTEEAGKANGSKPPNAATKKPPPKRAKAAPMPWLQKCLILVSSFVILTTLGGVGTLMYLMRSGLVGKDLLRDSKAPQSKFVIAGYLPEYRLGDVADWAPGHRLHHISKRCTDVILFSLEPGPSGALDTSRIPTAHVRAAVNASRAHSGRVLVSLGGAGRGQHFHALVKSDKKKQRFHASLVEYLTQHDLDGVDFNWEAQFPPKLWKAYAELVGDTKEALEPLSLLVTVAVHPWQALNEVGFGQADRVHVMAYDLARQHSTYEDSRSAVKTVVDNSKGTVDWEQIVMGIPLYGRHTGNPQEVMTYEEIVNKWRPPQTRDEVQGMYFNGIKTVERKAEWARDAGLAGVVVWEAGQDSKDSRSSLLAALSRLVKRWSSRSMHEL